jgi:hypothetical protein
MRMVEEPERGIRPIWLIGGGATLVTLTLCAIFSLATAVGLVLFSNNRNDNNRESTQVAIVRASEQGATAVVPTLTPLPALSTRTPLTVPTALVIATQNNAARPTPEQGVRTYYDLVSQQRYDLTWNLLTDSFKQRFNCCAPSYNYSGYTQWWDSVNYVEYGAVRTVSQNGDRAVVYAELYFVMNNGQRSGMSGNPYIELVYDAAMGAWRINDTRANA